MILKNVKRSLLAVFLIAGCSSDGAETEPTQTITEDETPCAAKCDSTIDNSRYEIDLNVLNEIWAVGGEPVDQLADFYSVKIDLPTGQSIKAGTHLFGPEIIPVPYHDEDGTHVVDAAGQVVFQGDAELARVFVPGEIGYAVKHHRPESRVLDFGALEGAGADGLKEDMKLQDTHIELVVGVQRPLGGPGGELVDGVITLNNPQDYQDGRFGDETYSMVFLKPAFPDYMPGTHFADFNHNIRTMMLGFNAVSSFPGDYNGGDPLAASDPDKVRNHVAKMIVAIAGEAEAQQEALLWFTKQENLIYCAELAHVATSAGLLVPLNRANLVDTGLVDEATFTRFATTVDEHNAGLETAFTIYNENEMAKYVTAAMAPEILQPLPSYGPQEEQNKLAFRPQTMAEIVSGFLSTHIPRNNPALGGEQLAPIQAAVLTALKPGLYEAMGMDDQLFNSMIATAQDEIASLQEDLADPEITQEQADQINADIASWNTRMAEAQQQKGEVQAKRGAVDGLFDQLVQVIGTSWESYEEFQQQLAPYMEAARQLSGPRDDSGTGFFVPPSALHLIALGCPDDQRCGGLVGLDYAGHGIHMSGVVINQPVPEVEPYASVFISDVYPIPTTDSNQDGEINARTDETVSLYNAGTAAADLSGFTISDEIKVRFEFPAGTILGPDTGIHINYVAEGDETFFANLGLNDNGDTVTLRDANGDVLDALSWDRVQPGDFVVHNVPE